MARIYMGIELIKTFFIWIFIARARANYATQTFPISAIVALLDYVSSHIWRNPLTRVPCIPWCYRNSLWQDRMRVILI